MNPPGYCARRGGSGPASSFPGQQRQPGRSSASASDKRGSFTRGRCYSKRSLRQRPPQHGLVKARALEPDDIGRAFGSLRTHPRRALDAADMWLDKYGTQPSLYIQVVQLKARALIQLNKIDNCIAFINALEPQVRNDKGVLMTKARALQNKGCLREALPLFQHLYADHAAAYKDHKTYALGLGRHLQLLGGAGNLKKAQAIYTRLRTRTAAGRENTPCDDKDIELALGRCLQLLGGADNLEKALAIYTRLRTRAAGGRENTPCNDKDIELTLGRCFELMGGTHSLQQALTIFTRLRLRAAGGRVNTPCNDKDIELTLARLLRLMGGEQNREQVWAIYTRLRHRTAGGLPNSLCNDKDIELALAGFLIDMEMWSQFDELRIEARHFPGFEPHLCLSVRHFRQLLGTPGISPAHVRLLGRALKSAVLAVEVGGLMNASCLSQLAHCVRLLSFFPKVWLQEGGIQHKQMRGLRTAAKFLFDTASKIAPWRRGPDKDQDWRVREQELLTLLSQQTARKLPSPLTQ